MTSLSSPTPHPRVSSNPNPINQQLTCKTSNSEEGELSSDEQDILTEKALTTVVSPPPVTTEKTIPKVDSSTVTLLNKYPPGSNIGKTFHAGVPIRTSDFVPRSIVNSNSHNVFQPNQLPITSGTSKWYAPPGSKDNLVIRFSDDDSSSDSEECGLEKVLESKRRLDNIDANQRPDTSSFTRSELLQQPTSNGTKHIPSCSTATLKNKSNGAIYRGVGPSISKQKGSHYRKSTPVNRNLLNQECGSKQGAVLEYDKLQDLRQQIEMRENELKLKSIRPNRKTQPVSGRDYNSLILSDDMTRKRRADSSDVTQSGQEGMGKKRFKAGRPCSNETILKKQPVKTGVKSDLQIEKKVDHSFPTKNLSGAIQPSTTTWKKQDREQELIFMGNSSFQSSGGFEFDATCSRSGINTRLGGPDGGIAQSLNQDSSDLWKLNAGMHKHNTTRSNQCRDIQFDGRLHKPESGCINLEHPFQNANGKFGSSNVHVENTTAQGQLSNEDLLECSNMTLRSFLAFEEMLDKELDKAQEIRRMCEIEERKAFKAYRQAQRGLMEANARCNNLYRQRELNTPRFQSFFIKESDSMWSSRLHERVDNATNAVNNPFGSDTDRGVPSTDHPMHVQRDNASPGGYDTNVCDENVDMCQKENQIVERQLLGLAECTEPVDDISDLQLRNRNMVNGVCSLSSNPIMSVDEGEVLYSSDHESIKTNDGYQEEGEKLTTRERDINNNSGVKFPDADSQDSLLLEAHLRSKLFARLGNRTLMKNSGVHSAEHSVEIDAEDDIGSEGTQTSAERLSHAMVVTSQHSNVEVVPVYGREAQCSSSSSMRCAFDHVKFTSPRSSVELRIGDTQIHGSDVCNKDDNGASSEKTECSDTDAVAILGNVEDAFLKKIGSYSCDLDVDPFWPLCMYELRGRCNDEQCCWQHFKDFEDGSKKQGNETPKSGLVQSIIQPSRESVCTSLAVSRLLQINFTNEDSGKNLCIQAHERWNWQSSYFQNRGQVNLIKEDSADTIQSLEKAILVFNQEVDKSEAVKKALEVLSRALEVDSTSAILWVPYLLIYYVNKKAVGDDDMFLVAVDNNKASFDLWLLYINSRMQFDNRLVAYGNALSALCRHVSAPDRDTTYESSVILDLFLQMLDFLCMSGHEEKAIQGMQGLYPTATSNNPLSPSLTDILNCLNLPDKCIFWVSCVYLLIYRKLPETVVCLFEFEKELLEIEWPSINLRDDEKHEALELMDVAAQSVMHVNIESRDEATLKSLYWFSLSHIRCTLLLGSLESSTILLEKYVKLYPSCLELVLQFARQQSKESFVGFEEALAMWPKEVPGIQCIWNQYAEYALEKGRAGLAKEVMVRWYESIWRVQCPQNGNLDTMGCDNSRGSLELASTPNQETCMLNFDPLNKMFGWLNLNLHHGLQNDYDKARIAIDNGMRAAPQEYYKHCVREHAKFMKVGSELNDDASMTKLANSLNAYVADTRTSTVSKLLSRKFIQMIGKPRVGQLVDSMLRAISSDSSVINLVLEAWFGPSLLPHKFSRIKDLVNFVEAVIKFSPTNYQFALSVCKYVKEGYDPDAASPSVLFWVSFLLVNAIFQAVPVAPEFIWVEASSILSQQAESTAISKIFRDRALSVYLFSVKLWKSNLNICGKMMGNTSSIVEAAKEIGINLIEI